MGWPERSAEIPQPDKTAFGVRDSNSVPGKNKGPQINTDSRRSVCICVYPRAIIFFRCH